MPFLASTTTFLPILALLTALTVGVLAATATAAVVASAASPVAMVGNAFMPTRTPGRRLAFPAGCDASTHATRQHCLATLPLRRRRSRGLPLRDVPGRFRREADRRQRLRRPAGAGGVPLPLRVRRGGVADRARGHCEPPDAGGDRADGADGARVLPDGPGGRAPRPQRHRPAAARADVLQRPAPQCDGLSGQRQGRRLDRHRGRGPDARALQARRLLSRRGVNDALLDWYAANRRDLPWRRTTDPYAILVSEVMLQQTQVARVIPRYLEWLERWPTAAALAAASRAEVLAAWVGLGYNRRALALHAAAA